MDRGERRRRTEVIVQRRQRQHSHYWWVTTRGKLRKSSPWTCPCGKSTRGRPHVGYGMCHMHEQKAALKWRYEKRLERWGVGKSG